MGKFNLSSEKEIDIFIEELSYEKLDIRDDEGSTILHKTVEIGTPLQVQILLDAGADVNIKNNVGNIPAHIAAMSDDVAIFKLLLDYGSDSSIRNNKQKNFEDIVRINKSKRIEKILRNYNEDKGYTVKIQAHKKWDGE